MSVRAVLLAGGNLGDVRSALERAAERVEALAGNIEARSGVYQSQAWGFEAGERFLNQAWVVRTTLGPEELLDVLEEIERELGRGPKGGEGYRSRTMDIDIILYGGEVVDTPRLKIPHPLMARRRFVLEPLAEVTGDTIHPATGRSVKEMLDEFELWDQSGKYVGVQEHALKE